MQRVQTCELPDDFRHVCFKDLQAYINIDNFIDILKGYSEVELNEIKKALGLPSSIYIDKDMNMYSTNPVENRAVFEALSKKVDKDRVANIAITGQYRDLKGTPIALPNPEGLVIQDVSGEYQVYDGTQAMKVTLPQSIKDLKDWKDFVVDYDKISKLCPIKNIALNGVLAPIGDNGTVVLTTLTWDEVNKKLQNYVTVETLNEVQQQLNDLSEVSDKVTILEQDNTQHKTDIQTIKNSITSLTNQITSLQADIQIIKTKLGI